MQEEGYYDCDEDSLKILNTKDYRNITTNKELEKIIREEYKETFKQFQNWKIRIKEIFTIKNKRKYEIKKKKEEIKLMFELAKKYNFNIEKQKSI